MRCWRDGCFVPAAPSRARPFAAWVLFAAIIVFWIPRGKTTVQVKVASPTPLEGEGKKRGKRNRREESVANCQQPASPVVILLNEENQVRKFNGRQSSISRSIDRAFRSCSAPLRLDYAGVCPHEPHSHCLRSITPLDTRSLSVP
ncbi:hypothetical protein NL676_032102 [Syzygium grande]|nr:hypothetical protein NL676_032102 [Syzygium grande]